MRVGSLCAKAHSSQPKLTLFNNVIHSPSSPPAGYFAILAYMNLGVFDSGVGGEAVARALARYFPDADILTINDHEHVPYGNKTPEQVRRFTEAAIQPLLGRDAIIIACNTATMFALPYLRETYPQQQFIGIEPMVKPAAQLTKSGIICVCAPPGTLASERYNDLKSTYATHCRVIEPDCSDWATMIQQRAVSEQSIRDTILPALDEGADVIVLGCTHYHWIKELIERIVDGRAVVIEPSEAVARRVKEVA